jgi:hypothetical protein
VVRVAAPDADGDLALRLPANYRIRREYIPTHSTQYVCPSVPAPEPASFAAAAYDIGAAVPAAGPSVPACFRAGATALRLKDDAVAAAAPVAMGLAAFTPRVASPRFLLPEKPSSFGSPAGTKLFISDN